MATAKDDQRDLIVKSNHLVEASYRLSRAEQRLVLSCISQVQRKSPLTDAVFYSVHAKDFAQLCGTDQKTAYRDLAEASHRLMKRQITLLREPDGTERPKRRRVAVWVQTCDYIEAEGRVELQFGKAIVPYLSNLEREFTQYALSEVAALASAHAVRIFELIAQFKDKNSREVSLEWLRERLELTDRYPILFDFKKRVLVPAVEQITAHTGLDLHFTERKTGRRVTHITFHWKKKAQTKAKAKAKTKPAKEVQIDEGREPPRRAKPTAAALAARKLAMAAMPKRLSKKAADE